MVDQVGAHARPVGDEADPVLGQKVRRADARQHEQVRRTDRPRGQHDLARVHGRLPSAVPDHDADGTRAVHDDAPHGRLRHDVQVGPVQRGAEESRGGRMAQAAALGHLIEAQSLLPLAVEVVAARHLQRVGGGDEGARQGVGLGDVLDAQLAFRAVVDARAANVRLLRTELRRHVVPAPSIHAPAVVVGPVAAHVAHGVDAAGAARAACRAASRGSGRSGGAGGRSRSSS